MSVHLLAEPWEKRAACASVPADLFWPEVADPRHPEVKRAKAVCARCPVRTDCLEDALANSRTYGRWGIRGGLTEQERRNLRRRTRRQAA